MRQMLIAVCSGALLLSGLGSNAWAADAEKKTVEGELVDTHCYTAGGATGADHGAKCGAGCAKSGIPVAVLAGGKVWTLATNPAALADNVGKTVRVTGTQGESMIMVPDKIEVKDGETWKEVKMKDAHHKSGEDEKKEEKKG